MKTKTTGASRFSPRNLALIAGIIIVIIISYAVRVAGLEHNYSYDQGIHLILARLWAAGYAPYQEIFVSYPPVFMWSMGVPWKLFARPEALQLLMATYAIAGVAAIVYLGAAYNSLLAGIVAGLLLSFAPPYFNQSITIMGEVPSVGVAVVAVALAEKYRRSGGWGWLVVAGVTLAISLSLKILPFYAVPFLGLMVLVRFIEPNSWTATKSRLSTLKWLLLRDMLILGGSFTVAFLLPVLFFDSAALFDQVVGMRLVSREAQFNALSSNNKDMVSFIFGNPGLTALAIYGLVFVVARDIKNYWLLPAWFIFIWISMYFHVPLRGKHLLIFLPVLALFAGFAVNHIVLLIAHIGKRPFSQSTVAIGLAIFIVVIMFGWNISQSFAGEDSIGKDDDDVYLAKNQTALDFIKGISTPADCVIADNPVFLYHTNRLPPPELAEVSHTRIETGYLTFNDMTTAIQTHQCYVVVNLTPRFVEDIPELLDWLKENYLALHVEDNVNIYFAPKFGNDATYTSIGHNFGDVVQLSGVNFANQPLSKGKAGYVSLFWQLNAPLQSRFVEKLTARNTKSGQEVLQLERLPLEGQFEPAHWGMGEQIKDTFQLKLPNNLPAGDYELHLSVCLPETGQCLPEQDSLHLGQIAVTP